MVDELRLPDHGYGRLRSGDLLVYGWWNADLYCRPQGHLPDLLRRGENRRSRPVAAFSQGDVAAADAGIAVQYCHNSAWEYPGLRVAVDFFRRRQWFSRLGDERVGLSQQPVDVSHLSLPGRLS